MKYKTVALTAVLLPLLSKNAMAATAADFGRIPVLINVVILAGAIASLAVAIRLLSLVRGGALAKGWQLWVISFFSLAFAQVVVLAEKLHFIALSFDISGVFYLVTVVLWFMGLVQTRRVLG
jgi:Flp pilus assembly pilin Flp